MKQQEEWDLPKVENLAGERVGVRGFGNWGHWHLSAISYGAIGGMRHCRVIDGRGLVSKLAL